MAAMGYVYLRRAHCVLFMPSFPIVSGRAVAESRGPSVCAGSDGCVQPLLLHC